jgi:two-component system, NarL family, nitrate/nitrite response regulator NarL
MRYRKIASRVTPKENVRVMAVAESRLGAVLLGDALRGFSHCEVVGSLANCDEALATPAGTPVDVAVINQDLEGERLKGLHLAKLLSSASPDIKPVIIVDSPQREVIGEAFQSGAKGIFHQGEPIDALWDCVCQVYHGQIYANQTDISSLVQTLAECPPMRLLNSQGRAVLTKKEQLVAQSVTEGYTNREIAKKLQLSEHTVKNYLFRIFDRLGVSSRAEMVFYVLNHRALVPGQQTVAAESSYAKAAQAGCVMAQYRLGEMYDLGRSVPRDRVTAYMWLAVAEESAASVLESARSAKNRLAARMTRGELATAESRAIRWRNESGQGNYDHECQPISHLNST